nr:2OG-Fe dioxygenase family protein [Elizabethkingia argenteiflava]
MMIEGVTSKERPFLDYQSEKWISTVFNLRTITTPILIGEPALEGVHTDGVDHTMTILLNHKKHVKR